MRVRRLGLWLGAFLVGALAPALALTLLFLDVSLLPLVLAFTLGHALVLGLPAALLFRLMRWKRYWSTALAGGVIGMAPLGLAAWPPTTSETVPIGTAWLEYLEWLGLLAGLGAIGATAFWLVLWWGGVLDREAPEQSESRMTAS